MAGINIKNIPNATSLSTEDYVIVEQTAGTKKTSINELTKTGTVVHYTDTADMIAIQKPDMIEKINNMESGLTQVNSQLEQITILMTKCVGDGIINNTPIIQNYIDNTPYTNITLKFSDGTYNLDSDIDFKSKSINVLNSDKVSFIGNGKFPTFATNKWHEKNGNMFTLSPSKGKVTGDIKHGDSALSLEVTPTDEYVGNACALFSSAKTGNCKGDVWSVNPILRVDEGFEGIATGMEIDIDNFSSVAEGVVGLLLTGLGSNNINHAMLITRNKTGNSAKWLNGITINEVQDAINIENAQGSGVLVKNTTQNGVYIDTSNVGIYVKNTNNNGIRLVNNLGIGLSIEGQNSNHLVIRVSDDNNPTSYTQTNYKADGSLVFGVTKEGGLKIGGGDVIRKHISLDVALDFGTLAPATQIFKTVSIPGVVPGDSVIITPKGDGISTSVIWTGVSGTDQVQVRMTNFTSSQVVLGSRNYRIDIFKH